MALFCLVLRKISIVQLESVRILSLETNTLFENELLIFIPHESPRRHSIFIVFI